MSGQLVGEVLGARAEHLADLTQAETLALVAIAEKCHVDSRQGSVRLAYIQAAIGKSQRTVVRTLGQLKDRGLIRVVKRGYKSHGVARASVYELALLAPPRVAQAGGSGYATQDGATTSDVLTPNPDVLTPSMGGVLDGPCDGSLDGSAGARGAAPTLDPGQFRNDPLEAQSTIRSTSPAAAIAAPDLMALPVPPIHWPDDYPRPEPPVRCPKHANHHGWLQETCPPCGTADKAHKAWGAKRAQWRKDRAAAIQAWIAACDQCDEAGWLMDDPEDELPAVKCLHAPNVIAWSALHPDWQLHGPDTQHRRAS